MNYPLFVTSIRSFVTKAAENLVYDRVRYNHILQLENALKIYLDSLEPELGFKSSFHFQIKIQINPKQQDIKVNTIPLTPIGVDICIATGIPIDDSLQARIRKQFNQALAQEILSDQRREADQSERSLRDDAREGKDGRLEEHHLEEEGLGSSRIPVDDPRHSSVLRLEEQPREVKSASEQEGDRDDNSGLRSTERVDDPGSDQIQGS